MNKTQDRQESLTSLLLDEHEFVRYDLPPESIVAGEPVVDVAVFWESPDARTVVSSARFSTGTLTYTQTADEVIYVTAGRMVIVSDDGTEVVASAGSVVTLGRGHTYRKDITEDYEEISVMCSDAPVVM